MTTRDWHTLLLALDVSGVLIARYDRRRKAQRTLRAIRRHRARIALLLEGAQ